MTQTERPAHIIFVDDESNVLDGLRRMLHPMRKVWQFEFFDDARQALVHMASNSVDIVVTDIRMPGMDGETFLKKVQEDFPNVVRIALSGHADRTAMLRLTESVHQYVSKPATPETLQAVLARAIRMGSLIATEQLRGLLSQIKSLPSLPQTHFDLVNELDSPNATVSSIEKIVARDMGMTSKVLQLVNSSFFGLSREIRGVGQAISLLGLDTLKALSVSTHVFSQFDSKKCGGLKIEDLWEHSTATSVFAKCIAKVERASESNIEDAGIGGLLHDIGRLVMATQMPEVFGKAQRMAEQNAMDLDAAEQRVIGATHAEIGAYLLGLWGLPDSIVEVVLFHHHPSTRHSNNIGPLTFVHAADVFAHRLNPTASHSGQVRLDATYVTDLNLVQRLPYWQGLCTHPVPEGARDAS